MTPTIGDEPSPSTFGRYAVDALLFDDWLGVRYHAHSPDGSAVLLRVLAPQRSLDPLIQAAARAAPAAFAGIQHPTLTLPFAAETIEGRLCLASPFAAGQPLSAWLRDNDGPWPADLSLALLGQIAAGLDVVHARGLAHGYLAPAHILVDADGTVVLCDFGLAPPADLEASAMLTTAVSPDTAPTTSPEVLAGALRGSANDLYALAALAYRLLAGQWPFPADAKGRPSAAQLAGQPADPRQVDPQISRELAAALLRGLARDPAQRFPNAATLIDALSAAATPPPSQQIGLEFAAIPGGSFTFGEGPSARLANLPGYQLTVFPVTKAQFAGFVAATGFVTQAEHEGWGLAFSGSIWQEVTGATWRAPRGPGSDLAGRDQHPVVQVSCADALAFCEWAGLALPSEEQWEHAARGHDGRLYPWGDRLRPELCNHSQSGWRGTAPVDAFPGDASPFGVRCLAGNVWEWTASTYDPAGVYQVLRGGAWPHDGRFLTATFRYYALPGYRSDALGFRCVRAG